MSTAPAARSGGNSINYLTVLAMTLDDLLNKGIEIALTPNGAHRQCDLSLEDEDGTHHHACGLGMDVGAAVEAAASDAYQQEWLTDK